MCRGCFPDRGKITNQTHWDGRLPRLLESGRRCLGVLDLREAGLEVSLLRWAVVALAIASQATAADPPEVRIRWGPYAPPPATIRVESKLVELVVTVQDAAGRPIDGLALHDFSILDNGHAQQRIDDEVVSR